MNILKNARFFLVLAFAAFTLGGCDCLCGDDDPSSPGSLSSSTDGSMAAAEGSSIGGTTCSPNGMSETHISGQGRDVTVTFTRANFYVVLAHVKETDNTMGTNYTAEVEIVLPSQSRVYNITKNGTFISRRDNKQYMYMADLTLNALNERYTVCVPQYPNVFWRPKDLTPPVQAQILAP